ncbi:MAG: metallophosphoesterase [Mobilitalea sp.]
MEHYSGKKRYPVYMMIKKNKLKKGYFLVAIIIIFLLYGFYSRLETTYYTYQNVAVPQEFNQFKIAFLSDFHCKEFGKNEKKLIDSIDACEPDLIVFTGDVIDGSHKDLSPVEDLLSALSGRYPMYAVSGNHERDNLERYQELLGYYDKYGVVFLDDAYDVITIGNAKIGIYGKSYEDIYYIKQFLNKPDESIAEFNILLYHDATAFPIISATGYDLILSGHTHGGIIRIPFLGGLLDNNGGLIADYDNGLYTTKDATMISSRGLGDAWFPRYNNRSELVCVTLRAE